MKLTIKHYYHFGNQAEKVGKTLITQQGWDTVRLNDEVSAFSIPSSREQYIGIANTYRNRGEDAIVNIVKELKLNKILSIGSGCGWLEYNIKAKYPDIEVTATDFNSKSLERLKAVFIECDSIQKFDMLNDNLTDAHQTLVLMHRIDTELDNKQWQQVFEKMSANNVENILIVATGFVTFKMFILESIKGLLRKIKHYSFCGYTRTKSKFITLWEPYYFIEKEMQCGELTGFLIKKR